MWLAVVPVPRELLLYAVGDCGAGSALRAADAAVDAYIADAYEPAQRAAPEVGHVRYALRAALQSAAEDGRARVFVVEEDVRASVTLAEIRAAIAHLSDLIVEAVLDDGAAEPRLQRWRERKAELGALEQLAVKERRRGSDSDEYHMIGE